MERMLRPVGKVLVLGDDVRSFLSVIRSLGRRGLDVHVAWCSANSPARFSRYVSEFHSLPAYSPGAPSWIERFKELLQRERFNLVVPCDDPRIIPLQFNRSELEPLARIYLLDNRAFQITSDKLASQELAGSLGIAVPRSARLDQFTSGIRRFLGLRRFGLPLVLKPLSSFTQQNTVFRNRVRKAYSYAEAEILLARMLAGGPVLVEENFVGRGVGVEVLVHAGEVLTAFQHERVHEPLLGGGSSYRRSVPLHPPLFEASCSLMRALSYTGVAMVEFKLNPKTGRWVMIEINGRFWGSLPLALAAGAEFPWFLYQMLVLEKRDFPRQFRTGLYCRNWTADVDWLRANMHANRSDPTLATRPLTSVLGELRHLAAFRERSDTLVIDDPKPAWVELRQWAQAKWTRLRSSMATKLSSMPLLRARARRSARRALHSANTVFFVCQGNICRSPFAEALARRVFNHGATLLSAGFDKREGRATPPQAQEAAAQLGVDLSGHRSKTVTEELLRSADVIFLFDAANYCRLASEFPSARHKAHFLGIFDETQSVVIPDPWGSEQRAFLDVYRRIQRALAKLAGELAPSNVEADVTSAPKSLPAEWRA